MSTFASSVRNSSEHDASVIPDLSLKNKVTKIYMIRFTREEIAFLMENLTTAIAAELDNENFDIASKIAALIVKIANRAKE